MASATQVTGCPPCGPDAMLCCRALVINTLQDTWQNGHRLETSESATAQVFSTRRPRDAIAGTVSGLKTFGRSLAAGSAALICTPLEAAKDGGGVLRTLQGVCEGAANAALLPCAGAAVAAAQFTRGVAATPQAVVEALRGRQWNQLERCWKSHDYTLHEEAEKEEDRKRQEVESRRDRKSSSSSSNRRRRGGTSGTGSSGSTVQVHRREYYGLLRVNHTASDVEIRRAYYRESRRCHPDKAGTEPQMVERFQQLSQAYQVLRNSELRAAYDAGGQDAVNRLSATLDLGSLYSAVLSGAQWEPYVGRLAFTRILSNQDDHDGQDVLNSLTSVFLAADSTDAWQACREIQCAQMLVQRLQPAVDNHGSDFEAFASTMRHEIGELAKAPFAPALLLAIADVYDAEAAQFLGAFNCRVLTLGREFMQTRSQGRLMLQQACTIAATTRAMLALRSLISEETHPGTPSASSSEEPRATTLCLERPAVQEKLPLLALALWRFTVLDVEGTLRRVCKRVLCDVSVEFQERHRRAEALQLMACVIREVADASVQDTGAGAPGDDRTVLLDKVSQAAALMTGAGKRGAEYAGATSSNMDGNTPAGN